jgi:hypothetical protein
MKNCWNIKCTFNSAKIYENQASLAHFATFDLVTVFCLLEKGVNLFVNRPAL